MREYNLPDLDLHIYRARIYDLGSYGDDRLQVRILPKMADYKGSDLENLPRYPCMFKGTVINGWSEKNPNPDTKLPDTVFVAATEDFTVGYVLGVANMFYTCASTPFLDSYGYSYIENFISSRGLDTSYVNYEDMVVEKWVSTNSGSEVGGYVEMYNFKTGDKYIINASGTCFIMQSDRIYMRVGSPSGMKSAANKQFSTLEMTNSSINLKTSTFDVDAKKIVLGHHGLNLLATSVSSAAVSAEGMDLNPITTVTV